MALRRACFTARRLPCSLTLPLSSPSHHLQRPGQTSQQLRALSITSAWADQRRPPSPPRYLPSDRHRREEEAKQFEESIDAETLRRVEARLSRRSNQKQWLLYALYAANTAVFVAWTYSTVLARQADDAASARKAHERINFMMNNFVRSEENDEKGRWWTNLTSAISQKNVLHLGINMYTMRIVGSYIVSAMPQVGLLSFAALCAGSTLAASAGAKLSNRLTGDHRPGLGSSGMLCGIASAATCAFPAQLGVNTAIWFAIDLGVLSTGGSAFSPLGHGAHLGGTVFGVLFYLVAIRRGRFPKM